MKKLVLLFLFTALTAAGLLPQSASAQVERGSETVYIRPQVGISYYMGDNEKSPFNFDGDMFDTFPYNLGAELGYQFTPSYSLGLRFTTGQYTQITDFEATTDATDHPNSRWSVGLVARKLLSDKKIAPYWFAGRSALEEERQNVYSPTCAAGYRNWLC